MKLHPLPDLRAAFEALDKPHRRAVQLALCRHGLGMWEAYLQREGPITYLDSVVGLAHSVDGALLREALVSVEAGVDQADVSQRYLEPIAALQDDDLELPGHIELAYYAIYSLYRSAVEGAAIDEWLMALCADAKRYRQPGALWALRTVRSGCLRLAVFALFADTES